MFVLYGAAHALMIGSIIAGIIAALWLIFRACNNYRISTDQPYASRHRRARVLVSAPSLSGIPVVLLVTWR